MAGPAAWSKSRWRQRAYSATSRTNHRPDHHKMTRNSAHDATRFSSGKVMMLLRTAAPHYSRSPLFFALMSMVFMGCGTNPSPKPEEPVATKPAEPAVPAEIQSAAEAHLGAETNG